MSRPHRLDAAPYVGAGEYFLTFCTLNRRRTFVHSVAVGRTLDEIRRTASEHHFALLAYCFMPDHVHFLIEALSETSDLRRFVKLAKQRSGAVHAMATRERLWQEGYYERVLRRSEDAISVARYIVANPVRAGLVISPKDYPHLGSDVWPIEALIGSVE